MLLAPILVPCAAAGFLRNSVARATETPCIDTGGCYKWRESFCVLVASPVPASLWQHWEARVETVFCLRCNREIEARHKSVAVYMFAQTVGIKPRQKSAAQRICFCPPCSVSLAMGPAPEGALNLAAWNMLRDLVASDPALNQAAWENLRGISGLLVPSDSENGTRPAYFEF